LVGVGERGEEEGGEEGEGLAAVHGRGGSDQYSVFNEMGDGR
jgi:hypothetical protein